ncbi:uncharacterized protein LOC135837492 [Planococcus citri]|uniref:uncharacterized protein LOC135837492 n=1 Tax=Planococcus citri TaxID=170843 RepID=UPI0031F96F7D
MQENAKQCQSEFSTINIQDKSILELFQLLNEGEIETCNLRPLKEATLILGNSGSGKTTFTRRIAGYGSALKSVFDVLDYKIVSWNSTVNSESFINSNTKFPEQIEDKRTGAVYYDFPGFKDTRGSAHDIATTYFIKKILDNVEQVKMLVLINYVSLTEHGTRDDFTSILQHVAKFVRNIEKYKDGVALIATKVPYPKLQDDVIVASIAKFIEKVQQDLKNKKNPSEDYSDAIKLINIILQKEGNIYPKIGISRTPDDEGLLSEIPLLKTNEEKIKTKLDKLKFVKKDDTDFGYIIPKQSLIGISNLLNQINDSITASVREIGKEIQKYLSAEEDRTHDIGQFFNFTSIKYNELEKTKEKANTQDKIEKCTQEVINGIASLNINSAHQNMLMRYGNYSTFLRQISDNAINDKFKCADGLQDVIKYSFKLGKWYNFLDNLYDKLSSYDVQSDIDHSQCTAFANQATKTIQSKKKYTFKFDQPDLKSCYPYYESQLEDIKEVTIDEPKSKALEKVLNSTMTDNASYSCENNKLVIKGHFLKLKDIPDIQARECRTPPKFIEIFALNEIFINADLDKTGEQVQLSIVAPVWNIQGSRKITLDGKPGWSAYPTKATQQRSDGSGADGQRGTHGGPGGNFIGIGDTFENLQGLAVSARGGNGGRGQDGADGANGSWGANAYNDVYLDQNFGHFLGTFLSFGLASLGRLESKNQRIVWRDGKNVLLAGRDGQPGSDGGDGGSGGRGGNTGEIMFAPMSSADSNHLRTVTGMGTTGSGGKGGEGGTGGVHGNNLYVYLPTFAGVYRDFQTRVVYRDDRRAAAGSRGRDGYTYTYDAGDNEESDRISNLPDIVNEYIKYATENLQRSPRESYLTQFINKLKNDTRFRNNIVRRRRHTRTLKALKPSIRHVRAAPIPETQSAKQPDNLNTDNSTNAKSAGVRIHSPINFAANLMSNFFGQWKLFGASTIFNYGLVKGGMELLFRDSTSTPSNIHTTPGGGTHCAIKPGNFNINESLALVDFAIRCITKKKFYNSKEQSMDLSEVTATALNIITEFEEILSDISAQYNLPSEFLEFDPVTLISKLEKELINQNYHKVGEILYQSIESEYYKENPQFHSHMLGKLDEILNKQEKHHFKRYNFNNDNFKSHNNASNVNKIESFYNRNMHHLEAKNLHNLEQISA